MKQIPLTNSDKFVSVDDEDFERVSSVTWALTPQGYARRNVYLGRVNGKPKHQKLYLHRFLMDTPKGLRVDHINHDKLNCTRANLRNVPCALNNLNRTVPKDHPTGVNGVTPTESGKFAVAMSIGNKVRSFGVYPTLAEATLVRKNLEKQRYEGSLVG